MLASHAESMELLEQMLILFPQHQGLMQFDRCMGCLLMKIEASDKDPSSSVFQMHGFISDSNYVAKKKMTMVLFMNDRLVDYTALKRGLEVVYAATLPKASKPFIYMSIMLPPEHVDVNVHPKKRECNFLNATRKWQQPLVTPCLAFGCGMEVLFQEKTW